MMLYIIGAKKNKVLKLTLPEPGMAAHTYSPAWEGEVEGLYSEASAGKSTKPYLKKQLKTAKRSGELE
jgi:hypothetical protein